jgi:hypothetical protein
VRAPTTVELRQAVLAVSVLADVDVEPAEDGVTLPGSPALWISWGECLHALAGHEPSGAAGRARLTDWLRARRWCADLGPEALTAALRPVGLPVEHALHPGLDWVRERVLGDALDLGLGAVGLDPSEPEQVVLVPTAAFDAAGLDPEEAWGAARERLEAMGAMAAERSLRDSKGVLRPHGDCDVVTLLGARSLRSALADAAGGMAAAVVPMRRRGWTRLSLIDPAFGPAAAAATAAAERGFDRPLLITAEEVAVVGEGGRPQVIVLRDPAADRPWVRGVLYR